MLQKGEKVKCCRFGVKTSRKRKLTGKVACVAMATRV